MPKHRMVVTVLGCDWRESRVRKVHDPTMAWVESLAMMVHLRGNPTAVTSRVIQYWSEYAR
jgi:hypothetical protein